MVELLVLLGLHIDYPSDTAFTSKGLRQVCVLVFVFLVLLVRLESSIFAA